MAALLAAFVAAGGICAAAQDSASRSNQVAVQVRSVTTSADRATVQLTLPEAIASGSLHAVLNGKDVSSRFSYLACDKGVCMSAELSRGMGHMPARTLSSLPRAQMRASWPADALASSWRAIPSPRAHLRAKALLTTAAMVGSGTEEAFSHRRSASRLFTAAAGMGPDRGSRWAPSIA